MPLYEYRCEACGSLSELLQRIADPPAEVCPDCGGKLRKLISAPAFQFKGSGWYVTDYARGGEKESKSDADKESGSSKTETTDSKAGKSETSSSETKSETKPEGKSEGKSEGKADKSSATSSA